MTQDVGGPGAGSPTSRSGLGYLLVAGSAVGYGFMPVFAAPAYRTGLNVTTLLFLRFTVAAVLFAPVAWHGAGRARRRGWAPTRAGVLGAVAVGAVLYTAQAFAYFTTMRLAGAALAALLLYLYPAVVAVGALLLGRLAFTWRLPVVLLVAFAGVALAIGPVDGARVTGAGVTVGLVTALLYGTYVLVGDRLGGALPPVLLAWLMFASAAASFGTIGVATGTLRFDFRPVGWAYVIGLALACTIVGIGLFFAGLPRIGPTGASLVSLLECVTAIVASVLILDEPMTPLQWAGAAVVLAAAAAGATLTAAPPASPTD